jgi:CRP-like cAMP-binding protein
VVIPKENVYFLMRKYEEFMMAFLAYISNKVSFLSEKLRLVSLRSIRAKLAYYLLKESAGESAFRLKISKEDIARLFSVSRPALVKVMMEMVGEGIIDVKGREIEIMDRRALQNMF